MAETSKTQATKKNSNGIGAVPITDIIYRTLHYWPWVLLSLFICVGCGVLYLLCTPNVYMTSASILIKDNSGNNVPTAGIGGEEFANMGLFQNNTNIQNEMIAIMSSDMMKEVVKRLRLDVNYYTDGTFHKKVAYGPTLPAEVSLVDFPDNGAVKFRLTIYPDGKVSLSDMAIWYGDELDNKYTGLLNDTIQTAAGPVVVNPTKHYNKDEVVELEVDKEPMDWAADGYSGKLQVALNNNESTVVDLTLTDQSTQRARDILTTLIGVYNENWISDRNQVAVSTSNFINDRLSVIESELGTVDSDISDYKSAHLIPDLSVASSMYMSQNQQLSQDIMGLNTQLQLTRYIRTYLSADNDNSKVLPIPAEVSNADIQSQLTAYNEKILQRNSLLANSSEKNPLVRRLDEELSSLRGAIVASVDNSIVALQSQIKSLQSAQASMTSKIASNPTQAKDLLSVERQQKVKESLYLFLLQKREENELSQAFTAYNSRIIKKPASWGPTAPNSKKIILMSIFLGLAIPFGIVFLKENNNTKVRGRKDVEGLALPFLGEIPQYSSKKGGEEKGDKEILVRPKSRNIINEAFRVLRTNIEFMGTGHEGANVIAVTSFNPGSGKSFITVNTGMALAVKNRRVLVIDGDMRHGSASAYVGSPEKGLSDYLSGAVADISQLIVSVPECDNLKVLPIGKVPPNPTELLESPRFAELIGRVRSAYDYVLIDCPPIEVVADTQIIDRDVDRTIFVVRAGLLERSILPDLDRLYEEKKYRNMAFILNGTRNDQGRYGYSHSYRYGYGYGYGYGYNYGTNNK